MSSGAGEPTGVSTVSSAGPSVQQSPRGTALLSACVAVAFLVFCLVVQDVSGAWPASFTGYPDEPSHFVGAVMFRDWLVSGRWAAPLEFARNYYNHYPYFAVGYWPPLFSIVTGLWMLIAGVGRVQALFIPAVFAAGTGWLLFHLVRLRAGVGAAVCAGVFYLSLPAARQWMCVVMVDHMTTFLCIAAAACLLRYLKQPDLWNGSLCAAVSACAILSKYSAAYLVVLPFATVLFLRRFELLRKPSLLVQPLLVGLLVGPWAFWTRKLALYGLPSWREALTAKRAASFMLATFKIFPPAVLALVVLGLIVLLVRPKAWREDLTVLSLLAAGHLSFLIVSPAGPDESRYLLVPGAALLMAAFTGWSEATSWALSGGHYTRAIPVGAGILTMALVALQFRHFAQAPQDQIGNVVAFVLKDPARAAERIVVPPTLEGPVIAEFVVQSRHRPDDYLLRPSKILARSDWFGIHYSATFATAEEMMEYFRKNPVDLIMWNDRPARTLKSYEGTLGEMLRQYPLSWRKVQPLDSPGDSASSWTIYEYAGPPRP